MPILRDSHHFERDLLKPKKIYVNISKDYKRFKNFTDEEIKNIENYNECIEVIINNYDSPLIKHIGIINKHNEKNDFVFIGDDDQEYNYKLLENMRDGIYNNNDVYQNRYHVVKTGTAGIIHGFVGLMYRVGLLDNFSNEMKLPNKLWVDDQFMNIYFKKTKIK